MASITHAHPILRCFDREETIAFYQKLGFIVVNRYSDEYMVLARNKVELHFLKSTTRALSETSSCYIRCSDLDGLYAEFIARGVKCGPPEDHAWKPREFNVIDSNGNLLHISGPATEE